MLLERVELVFSIDGVDDGGGICGDNDGYLYLYNGKNELIAVAAPAAGGVGDVTLVVGDAGASGETLATSLVEIPALSGTYFDEILSTGETYTVKGDFYTDGVDKDAISATININASALV